MIDLEFYGTDPGAVRHGNFINYYSFHSAEERIQKLNAEIFLNPDNSNSCVCLDIGCNSGELTNKLYNYLTSVYPNHDVHILAIDIDPTLIKRAQENFHVNNVTYTCLDITSNDALTQLKLYLEAHNKSIFDITFCFSVTMWIHINVGDERLFSFLQLIKDISESVVIEPQPWNCYSNAQRRLKKSGGTFSLFKLLKIRSNVDTEIVNFMNSSNYLILHESSYSSWNRKIFCFQRVKS